MVKYKCSYCEKEFDNLKSMTNHRRWHKVAKYREFQNSQKVKMYLRNEKHFGWKGDDVGYDALHYWIKRRKPKPTKCENCDSNAPTDLANISGEYKRDVNDFEWLCRKCHMIKDGRMTKRDNKGRFK